MRLYTIFMITCTAGHLMAFPQPSSSEDLKMEARIDDEMEDYGAPGFLPFHNGEAFTVEKDPTTGTLDFTKKETPDYGNYYKDDIDRKDSRPKLQPYHTPNDIPSNPFKISAVDSSPDLHQFLNLPVHYSTSGKFPLISSSYANMKVQGSSSGSNHKHYTPSTTTTSTSTSQPPSYYTSMTIRSTFSPPSTTSARPTTHQERPSSTTKLSTPPTTTTTTPKPTTRTTTTEKLPPRLVPQQVWNISEPVDYLPEEEISYVDYEYEPEAVNQFPQQNGHGNQHQQNLINHQQSHHHLDQNMYSNTKETDSHGQKLENKHEQSTSVSTTVSTTTTTAGSPTTETTPKMTTTTSKVSIVTSAPISSTHTTPSVTSTTTPKHKDATSNQYSTSMPVTSPEETVRPGVGNTYLFSGNVVKDTLNNNNLNNFYRPVSNEEPFKPMPAMNDSFPFINQRPEPDDVEDYSYDARPPVPPSKVEKPSAVPQNTYQQQRPQNGRPNVEPIRHDPPFPFENVPPQFQGQFSKPNRPPQTEQTWPEKAQFDQRPHINQFQQNKNERPHKHPASSEINNQDTFSVEVGSNLYQMQNQYIKPDNRPNKYPQTNEPHQPFDVNVVKHTQNQFQKQPQTEGQPQNQFTAHLSTGPISHLKRPQNSNIHPSDLRPPPPPIYQNIRQDGQDEEANLVKKPIPSKPVKISSNIKPLSSSGGFVNIQPGKIQSMVPIRIPTEVDQNSQSYSLQTSFSIGASGEDSRHPVAHGSVIDENINNINRSEIVPPSHHIAQQPRPDRPQRPQNIRPPPPNQGHHWESYTPHHYPSNKVKTDSEVLKPNLPNILPQFRPNAKVGHVDPNTQYVSTSNLERVKQPLEHLQPPPLPRPQFLRIDRNDEEVQESMMHQQAKQSMRVFPKQQPTLNKVTTLQMMQQGQAPPSVPLKRIIRTESKPHPKFQEKQHKPMSSHTIQDKNEGGSSVHVVYPTTNQRLTPNIEDVVVVGTHGPQRPSPPSNLQNIDDDPFPLDDPVPFLMSDRDRDTPILKTKPNKPLKNDFPYSLVKHNDFLDEEENKLKKPIGHTLEENKIAQEYTAFSPTESTNKKMDPDTELNVIPYLQDYSPYATKKPPHSKPISVTLKNILANSTPKSNLATIERVEVKHPSSSSKHKFSSGNQEFTVGAVIDMHTGNHKTSSPVHGFVQPVNMTSLKDSLDTQPNVHKNHLTHANTPLGDVQTQDFQAPFQPSLSNPENQGWRVIGNITREYPEDKSEDSETTVKPSDFSFEQFKPQLFGGFKPIVPSESDEEEELELDA